MTTTTVSGPYVHGAPEVPTPTLMQWIRAAEEMLDNELASEDARIGALFTWVRATDELGRRYEEGTL